MLYLLGGVAILCGLLLLIAAAVPVIVGMTAGPVVTWTLLSAGFAGVPLLMAGLLLCFLRPVQRTEATEESPPIAEVVAAPATQNGPQERDTCAPQALNHPADDGIVDFREVQPPKQDPPTEPQPDLKLAPDEQ